MLRFALGCALLWGELLFGEAGNSRIRPVFRQPFAVTNVGRESASELRAPVYYL